MKNRDHYLSQLVQCQDKSLFKVFTGIRRCGKSTLLSLFEKHLLASGVKANRIIRLDFEDFSL